MNKKKGIKLGVCSLLVGLLALTACGKKSTTKLTTKVNPNPTTSKKDTTKKVTTKKTTQKQTTTEESIKIKSFNVYLDDELVTLENNEISFAYGADYSFIDRLKFEAIYSDDTKETLTINDLTIETDLTPTSNAGVYDVNIKYGSFTTKLVITIESIKIDLSSVSWAEDDFTYDGTSKTLGINGLENLDLPDDVSIFIGDNKATNAGEYTATLNVVTDNVNYSFIGLEELRSHKWTIKKQIIDVDSLEWDYSNPFTYDGSAHSVSITNLPTTLEVSYENNSNIDAGNYKAIATVNAKDDNYDVEVHTYGLDYVINKAVIDFSNVGWVEPDFTFNGETQTVQINIFDLPDEVNVTLSDNSAINAGAYVARFSISQEKDNYEFKNISDNLRAYDWEIKKLVIDISNCSWDYNGPITYDGNAHEILLKNLPVGATPIYENNVNTNAGTYTATATFESNNNVEITPTTKTIEYEILKKTFDFANVTWVSETYLYDGTEKELVLANMPTNLPDDIIVTIEGNKATNAGKYTASCIISTNNANYELLNISDSLAECNWEIEAIIIDLSNFNFITPDFTYDGTEKELGLTFTPEFPSCISFNITGNKATNAGTYHASVTISSSDANYVIKNLSESLSDFEWTIKKLVVDVSNFTWNYTGPIEYDGLEHVFTISNLPEGVEVTYTDNKATNAGTYHATATFTQSDNVEISPASKALDYEITIKEFDFADVAFETKTFTYNGSEQTLEFLNLPENLPNDILVTINGNKGTNAGTYHASLSITTANDNYSLKNVPDLSDYEWTINKLVVDVSNCSWDYTEALTYNGKEQVVVLKNLPEGVEVTYTDNKATAAGTYTATATFAQSDNVEVSPSSKTLEWKINKQVFDFSNLRWIAPDDNFVFDGKEHEIELTFTPELPSDIEVVVVENKGTNAGTYHATITITTENENYELVNLSDELIGFEWVIEKQKIDVSNLTWDYDDPFTYNNEEYEVVLDYIPEGLIVEYTDNKAKNAGTYTAIASLSLVDSDNYYLSDDEVTCDYEIEKYAVDLANVRWVAPDDDIFYDGKTHEIELTFMPEIPDFIPYEISGNTGVDADTYYASFEIDLEFNDNYVIYNYDESLFEFEWEIKQAVIVISPNDIFWEYDGPIEYSGSYSLIELNESLLPDGVYVYYDGNEEMNVGEYTATAYFYTDDYNYTVSIESVELDYKIVKAETIIELNFEPSRAYNGDEIDIYYYCNVWDAVVIYYKEYGADDSTYTTDAPKDAGCYTAKLYVEATDNYTECTIYVNFEITKVVIDKPTVGYSKFGTDNHYVTSYTGEEQEFILDGFNEEFFELYDPSDEFIQTDAGTYTYRIKLKDEAVGNVIINGNPDSSELVYGWTINGDLSNYISQIIINGNEISIDEFEAIEYFRYEDIIQVIPKTGYAVKINSKDMDNDTFTVYSNIVYIEIVDSERTWFDYYFKQVEVLQEFMPIQRIKINGEVLDVIEGKAYLETNETELTVELVLSPKYDYSNVYIWGYNVNINNPVKTIDIEYMTNDYFNIEYYCGANNYGKIPVYINHDFIFDSIKIKALDTSNNASATYTIENSGYSNLYGCVYNSIITGIDVEFNDKNKNATFKLFDSITLEEYDFTYANANGLKGILKIYDENEDEIYSVYLNIDSNELQFEGLGRYSGSMMTYFYKSTNSETTEIDLPNFGDWSAYDITFVSSKSNAITYDEYGVHREKVELKTNYLGTEYVRYVYVDIIYSEAPDTYTSEFGFTYSGYGESYTIYNGQESYQKNIITFNSYGHEEPASYNYILPSINDNMGNCFAIDPNSGYTFDYENSSFELLDADDVELARVVGKYVFTDGNNTYTIYALVYGYGEITNNTDIVDEVVYYGLYEDNEGSFDIVNDYVEITDSMQLISYGISTKDNCNFKLYGANMELVESNDITSNFHFSFIDSGTYYLDIQALSGKTRRITIVVTGQFGNLIETSIGDDEDREILYLDSSFKTNFIVDYANMAISGYYGAASQAYITNDIVVVNITGGYLMFLYKDAGLVNKVTGPTEEFVIHYTEDNIPYILIYMQEGESVMTITLYLADVPKGEAKFSFGNNQEFEYTFDAENGLIAEGLTDNGVLLDLEIPTTTFTFSLSDGYSGNGYTILHGSMDFVMDVFANLTSFTVADLKELGYAYTVDTTTPTVTIDLESMYIFIVQEDATTLNYQNVMPVIVNISEYFHFSKGDTHCAAMLVIESFESTDGLKVLDNADDTGGEIQYNMMPFVFAEGYYYLLGNSEIDNIVDGKYTMDFSTAMGIELYKDEELEQLITIVDGTVTMDVVEEDGVKYAVVFIKDTMLSRPIAVVFYFSDELPYI